MGWARRRSVDRIGIRPAAPDDLTVSLLNEDNMTIEQRMVGSVAVLDLNGRLVLGEGDRLLKDKINSLVFQQQKQIVLNLAGVSYMDSAGLGELVAAHAAVSKSGGKIKVINLTKRVSDLLSITKVLTIFDVYDSEADALKSLSTV
jgi:anti-sigma B factor antagonist